MNRITDEKLDKMLTAYCEAEPEQTFVWRMKALKAPIPFYKKSGFVAAASVILVSGAVIALMLAGYGKKPPVAVYTPPVSSETVSMTDAPTDTAAQTEPVTTQTEKPTELVSESQPPTSVIESVYEVDPAEETDAPQTVEEPTEKSSEAAAAPPQTDATDATCEPDEPPHDPTEMPGTVTCYGSISSDRLSEDGKVYFQIVATGQSIFDDPGVFDDSHLAQTNTTDDGFTIVSFTINRLNVYSPRKKHYYCFYNSNGDILYRDGFD